MFLAVLALLMALVWYKTPPAYAHLHGPDKDDESVVDAYAYKPSVYPGAGKAKSVFGSTQYYLSGNLEGEKVVLIHGISTPSIVFKDVVKVLVDGGYCVLTYDLYGRGYSDAPGVVYDEALYTMQLYLLLQHVGWQSCHIVGMSMGGAIATSFSHHYPSMVQSLTLLCPAGLMASQELHPVLRVLALPGLSTIVASLVSALLSIPTLYRLALTKVPKNELQLGAQVNLGQIHLHKGYPRAMVSTYANYPLTHLHRAYDGVGKATYPVFVVWGDQDDVVKFPDNADRLKWHIPRAKLHVITGEGHAVAFTRGDLVGGIIKDFLTHQ